MIRNGKIIKVQVSTNGSDQNQEQGNIQTEEEIDSSQDREIEANDLDTEEELDSDQMEGGSENQRQILDSSFCQSLAMLENIKDENKSIGRNFLLGDFNLGKKNNWGHLQAVGCARNSLEPKFIEQTMDCFLIQHTSEATRLREGQNPSMLDLVFSKEKITVEGITYHEPLGRSDHVLMNLSINISLKGVETEEKQGCYRLNRGDYDAMRKDLADYNWKQNFLEKSLEGMWDKQNKESNR